MNQKKRSTSADRSPRPDSQSNRLRNTAPSGHTAPVKRRRQDDGRDVERLALRRKYQQEKREARRASLIAFLSVLLLLCVSAVVSVYLITRGKSETAIVDVIKLQVEGSPTVQIKVEDVINDNILYIDFRSVATLCGFRVTGDASGVEYSFTSSSGVINTICFVYGSDKATVNGHEISMPGKALASDGEVSVPVDFIRENIIGLQVEYDEEKKTLSVTREKMTGSTPDNPKYEELLLRYQPETPLNPIDPGKQDEIPAISFRADLSEYEQYMNPEDRDAFLLLVNKANPVSVDYAPDDLEYIPQKYAVYSGEYQARMRAIAAKALTAMLTEAEEYGITDVKSTLAYRNYWTQNYLFVTYIEEEMQKNPSLTKEQAQKIVETYCAPPGTSEHQTGLCADMHNVYGRPDLELEDFEHTEAYEWLRDNCWKFGFIIRFPRGKEDITGYQFECWHFRFVGRYHAYKIQESGLCLEEYLEMLASEN
ncbi:MAG: D-alanyl-D-alanine carboxypeptidase family protein [Eubacteriales bacterium]